MRTIRLSSQQLRAGLWGLGLLFSKPLSTSYSAMDPRRVAFCIFRTALRARLMQSLNGLEVDGDTRSLWWRAGHIWDRGNGNVSGKKVSQSWVLLHMP